MIPRDCPFTKFSWSATEFEKQNQKQGSSSKAHRDRICSTAQKKGTTRKRLQKIVLFLQCMYGQYNNII
jgi:hypothetical protein